MRAIIAQNKAGFIGLAGGLPFKCRADLRHFAALTAGCTLLVGYRTAQTLPPLRGRKLIIDDRNTPPDLSVIDWCIGGAATYDKYQHLFTELHVSIISDFTVGDTYAPIFDKLPPHCKKFYYQFAPD